MKEVVESQPKSEEVKLYSKKNHLLQNSPAIQANAVATTATTAGKLSLKAILIIVSVSVAVVATSATLITIYAISSPEEKKEEDILAKNETIDEFEEESYPINITEEMIIIESESINETEYQEKPINYTKEEFYSSRTKDYLDLIDNLEKEKAILYHWNLELDQNNNAVFKNKYQDLYDYPTDLKPRNADIGYHLYKSEHYRKIDTDLINYYKAINETMPDHLIYGPSINGKEYAKSQSLFSDTIKLGKENKNGISISFNIKKDDNHANMNNGDFFGFNTKNKKGISVSIYWGVIYFKAGGYSQSYSYQDGVNLGYDENDAYTKYLYYRPFYDDRWHHICIVQKILDEDDLLYIKDKKVGDVMGEFFLDGMSRKNFSGELLNDYGNLTVFSFSEDDTKTSNDDFYIDEMMIFNKRLRRDEIKTLYEFIDQEAEKVIPKVSSVICKIPGTVCGPLPSDICPNSEEKLSAEIKVFHFTNKWTCLGINFNNFLYDRLNEFCGENLGVVDMNIAEGKMADWKSEYYYRYSILDVTKLYLPEINPIFTNLSSFSNYVKIESTNLEGGDKKSHKMINYGYWIATEGVWNIPKFYEELSDIESVRTNAALMNYFAYFELDEPYINNRKYTISFQNSEPISFIYNDNNIISHAIKINQNGYSPSVKKHYAYIGRWLGTFGALPIDSWIDKTFYIYDNSTKEKIFENKITWAKETDEKFTGQTIECDLNGEYTLLLNFTGIENNTNKNEATNLYIYIPGIGCSLPFNLSHKSVFNAFYTHMKGFYHQRTGIIHEKPYTNWEFPAHHKGIYVAHHIPNDRQYAKNIFFENGTIYGDLSQFEMIKATRTEEFWEDVYGGHADAGDFDNRPYHLKIIDNLAAVWFFNSQNLKDEQLNIPESGDGIPDIFNEMEWTLEIHHRIQKRFNNGGVSAWIESTSHPPGDSRYYTGLQTREDTLNYVEAAGMMALCFQSCENCDNRHFEKWKQSALWAWEWAKKEENQCRYSFNYTIEDVTYNLTYIEPPVADVMFTKAALVIYKLTSNEEDTFPYIFKDISELKDENKRFSSGMLFLYKNLRDLWALDAFPLVLYKDDERFSIIIKSLTDAIKRTVNMVLSYQENGNNTYRNAYFYPINHPYYASMAWGNFNGGPALEYLVMACHLMPEKKETFLQAISFYYDFSMGCNHLGKSFTTGLGISYPVRLVSHPNWDLFSKKVYDPIPGITLYSFTGQIEYETVVRVHMFQYAGRKDFGNLEGYYYPISPYLANKTVVNSNFSIGYNEMRNLLLEKIPFWRRGSNLEQLTIASSEFTVYETIVQMAMCTGMLLEHEENVVNCMNKEDCPSIFPTEEQINKKPKNLDEFKELLGRWSIP